MQFLKIIVEKPSLKNKASYSQAVYDRGGQLLKLTLSTDDKYRLWIGLDQISDKYIKTTLSQEDKLFFYHFGVNPFSLIKAALTTYLFKGRRVGGSTISMQLARMRFGINSRSAIGKIKQIFRALQLELHYSKEEILEAYLNTVPFGGNIEGVGAASLIYFKKLPISLSYPEAVSLSVIPQSPNNRTLSENAAANLNKAKLLLAKRIDAEQTKNIEKELYFSKRENLPNIANHLANRLSKENYLDSLIYSTIDLSKQKMLEELLMQHVKSQNSLGIYNADLMLVDYTDMSVRVYIGSANFYDATINGQVDGVRGKRSPGSALKPFIYALAMQQGLIIPETTLRDTALGISAYNPENFDREYLGSISATDALVRSRNVPAVMLTNQLSSPSLYSFLQNVGISKLKDEKYYGLALALGGAEVNMEELIKLYASLANRGEYRDLSFKRNVSSNQPRQIITPEAAYLTVEMLRHNPRYNEENVPQNVSNYLRIPWKTGTSFGFRDAWAMGIVGQYILGVWVGNFNGSPNQNFIGRDAAGPLFFKVAEALKSSEQLKETTSHLQKRNNKLNIKKVDVCASSGRLANRYCEHTKLSYFIPGVSSIKECDVHRMFRIDKNTKMLACPEQMDNVEEKVFEIWSSDIISLYKKSGMTLKKVPMPNPKCELVAQGGMSPLISSPRKGLTYTLRETTTNSIPFSAVTDGQSRVLFWFVNESFVGNSESGETFFWEARPGNYRVKAVDEQGRSNSIDIDVINTNI